MLHTSAFCNISVSALTEKDIKLNIVFARDYVENGYSVTVNRRG